MFQSNENQAKQTKVSPEPGPMSPLLIAAEAAMAFMPPPQASGVVPLIKPPAPPGSALPSDTAPVASVSAVGPLVPHFHSTSKDDLNLVVAGKNALATVSTLLFGVVVANMSARAASFMEDVQDKSALSIIGVVGSSVFAALSAGLVMVAGLGFSFQGYFATDLLAHKSQWAYTFMRDHCRTDYLKACLVLGIVCLCVELAFQGLAGIDCMAVYNPDKAAENYFTGVLHALSGNKVSHSSLHKMYLAACSIYVLSPMFACITIICYWDFLSTKRYALILQENKRKSWCNCLCDGVLFPLWCPFLILRGVCKCACRKMQIIFKASKAPKEESNAPHIYNMPPGAPHCYESIAPAPVTDEDHNQEHPEYEYATQDGELQQSGDTCTEQSPTKMVLSCAEQKPTKRAWSWGRDILQFSSAFEQALQCGSTFAETLVIIKGTRGEHDRFAVLASIPDEEGDCNVKWVADSKEVADIINLEQIRLMAVSTAQDKILTWPQGANENIIRGPRLQSFPRVQHVDGFQGRILAVHAGLAKNVEGSLDAYMQCVLVTLEKDSHTDDHDGKKKVSCKLSEVWPIDTTGMRSPWYEEIAYDGPFPPITLFASGPTLLCGTGRNCYASGLSVTGRFGTQIMKCCTDEGVLVTDGFRLAYTFPLENMGLAEYGKEHMLQDWEH